MPVTIQNSVHPYLPGTDETQTVTVAGAGHLILAFDALTDTWGGFDLIRIMDGSGNQIGPAYSGTTLAGTSVWVPGDTVQVRLTTVFGGKYGYLTTITTEVADVKIGPSLFDAATQSIWPTQTADRPGPYYWNNNVYASWADDGNVVRIWKSSDGGKSFSSVPGLPLANYVFCDYGSSASKIRMVLLNRGVNPTYPILIGEWDMATDTWATIYSYTGGATGYKYDPVNGADYVFSAPTVSGGRQVGCKIITGSLPGVDVNVSNNILLTALASLESAAVDPLGVLHVVYSRFNGFATPWSVFYRQVHSDGSMDAVIPLTLTTAATFFPRISDPGFTGTNVIIPVEKAEAGIHLWVGTPYAGGAPVFTEVTVLGATPAQAAQVGTGASGVLYLWWIEISDELANPQNRLRYAAYDGATLGPPLVFHDEQIYNSGLIVPFTSQFLHSLAPPAYIASSNKWGVVMGAEYRPGPAFSFCTSFYWLGPPGSVAQVACSITITAPPAPVVSARPRVVGSRRLVILEPNDYDDCLKGDPVLQARVKWGQRICCVPGRFNRQGWANFPPDAEPFRVIQSVATPLATDGDVLVVTYVPPIGYDGILHGIFQHYTGPGFRDGGGDIEWRLKFGPVYGIQMGRMLVEMGKIEKFYSLKDGIPLLSHRPLQYWVYAPNTSGGILPVNSHIVCGLQGWIFPRK